MRTELQPQPQGTSHFPSRSSGSQSSMISLIEETQSITWSYKSSRKGPCFSQKAQTATSLGGARASAGLTGGGLGVKIKPQRSLGPGVPNMADRITPDLLVLTPSDWSPGTSISQKYAPRVSDAIYSGDSESSPFPFLMAGPGT